MGVYTVNQTDGSLQRVAGGTLFADAPIASIIPFGGETAPAGWLICDGSTLSRTEYAELFAVIGISFGEGDGETTFGIPDLRECVPVGVGKNITKSIANHDRYDLGQFKDDALGTHDHPLKTVTTATYNTAGVPVGVAVNNTPTSATHGKQLGVNYIIKAKQVAVPADLEAQIDADYQKKDLTTPLTIGGVSQTTVEDALGALQSAKVDSSVLGRFKTITVTLSPSTQRTISFSNVAKRVRIDIDSTGANNNTQFHGVLVGYNEMTSNRLIGLYKRGTNGLLASMGSYELTLANPSVTATDTVILTFYNLAGNITTTISAESAITLTEMGDGWQELVTQSDLTWTLLTGNPSQAGTFNLPSDCTEIIAESCNSYGTATSEYYYPVITGTVQKNGTSSSDSCIVDGTNRTITVNSANAYCRVYVR